MPLREREITRDPCCVDQRQIGPAAGLIEFHALLAAIAVSPETANTEQVSWLFPKK